jgi:hypothetical protein
VDDFVFLGALRVKRAVDPVISVVRVRVFMVEQVMVSDKPSASWVVEHHSSYIDENAQRGERFYVKRNPQERYEDACRLDGGFENVASVCVDELNVFFVVVKFVYIVISAVCVKIQMRYIEPQVVEE